MAQAEHALPDDLFADLDRSGPVPLYFQVASLLERAIRDDLLPAGSRLENEISLGTRLGLSRPTVRRAIQELVDKGLLVRRRGIGTQVVHGKVSRSVELTSLFEDLERSGQHPTTRVVNVERGTADAQLAAVLGVAAGSPLLHVRRVRSADGSPLSVLDNVLPEEFADLTEAQLAEHGLYRLLRARGVTMRVAKQRIGARAATKDEAALLEVDEGSPLLTMERTAFDSSGRAIEHGEHCYRPDRYSFEMTLVDR